MRKRLWMYFAGIIVLILDQLFKWFAIDFVTRGGFFNWKFFEFGLYKNEGIAFGIKIPQELFYGLVIFIMYFIYEKFKKEIKERNFLIITSLILIGSGAISNIVDRIIRGYVVDYLHFFNISAINLADVVIVIGIGMLMWKEIWQNKNKKHIKTHRSE